MTPSFNIGRTGNIGATALNLANPGIAASNNQLDAMNKLAVARMNTRQGFAGLGNELGQQGLQFEQQQQDPGILGIFSTGLNAATAINNRDYRNKISDFSKLNNPGVYNPYLRPPELGDF